MTHTNTIETLIRLRKAALEDAATYQGIADEYAEYAAQKAAEVAAELEQAADFSLMLRELDPEHAGDYPDPAPAGPAVDPLVVALRQLADRYEAIWAIPEVSIGATIEVSLHGVALSAARPLAEAYAGDAEVKEHGRSGYTWLSVQEGEPEMEFVLRVHTVPDRVPFVKATPAEVAEAYESAAVYEAGLTDEPTPEVPGPFPSVADHEEARHALPAGGSR